jgi:hypothetical protein
LLFIYKEARKMTTDLITPGQFYEAEGVEDWRLTSEGAIALA